MSGKRVNRVVRAPASVNPGWVQAPDETGALPELFETSGRRARLIALCKWALVGAALLGAVGAFVRGTYQLLSTSDRFAIRQVQVEGNERFSEAQILGLAGLAQGANLFAANFQDAERTLLDNPWIERAQVTRQLPDRVKIVVDERQALALAALGNALFLISAEGTPFKAVEPGDPYDLPVITGITEADLALDRVRELERLVQGLEALRQYQRLALGDKHPVQEVALGLGGTVSLVVGAPPMTLHLGTGPWRKKLLMATRVLANLRGKGQRPGIVFLDNSRHPERVVVRMQ